MVSLNRMRQKSCHFILFYTVIKAMSISIYHSSEARHSLLCVVLLCCTSLLYVVFTSNQIKSKSNHFYCHITTAQVPWWVKFLWACSRQCRKTTDNLHMDRQCKKTTDNLHMDRQCKKTTDNLHMDRQCKKLHWSIYSAPDSAKKTTTAIYIWTVHITDCTEDNVQNTHTYTQYT